MNSPTGIQHRIARDTAAGRLEATVTELGAALRTLSVGGVDLVQPYSEAIPSPSCAGVVLVPWPNRIRDGVWIDEGVTRGLALTEPDLGNAIHGLLRYAPYRLVESADDAIVLSAEVFPQLGYPYHLDTRVRYELGEDGIMVSHTIVNTGSGDAPVAVGSHPFPAIGGVDAFELTLRVAADTHIDVDDRLNPTGRTPVAGTRFDLRDGVRVGDVDLDDAWADVHRSGGESVHTLTAPDGRSVGLWADESFDFVQVYSTDAFPGPDGPVNAVAVEPMTAPADAFNSGWGLRRLAPAESWTVRWGLRFAGF